MPKSDLLPVKKFAKLLHIPESTIRHYDRIGLLPSALRGENSYRYYSIKQAATINVIRTLQELGMPLSDIKKTLHKRTPESILFLLEKQLEVINENIIKWDKAKKLLFDIKNIIHPALDVNEDIVYIQIREELKIIRGEFNYYDNNTDDYDALFSFYNYVINEYKNICFYYPVWGMFSMERIKARDWKWPDRYYIYSDLGHDIIPKSLYAIGYTRCWYGQGGSLYDKMLKYIDTHGFEICGDVYEEYPLSELCSTDEQMYLMRLMMPVHKK